MPTSSSQTAPDDRVGATVWEGDVNIRSGPQMREYEAAADRIADDRPGRVLDWGCGYGQLSHLLKVRGLDVASIEWDPDCQEGEIRRLDRYPDVEAVLTRDPVGLPYPDHSFDAVLSMGVLEHVQSPEGSLDEIHRVLRPGGTLYVYKLPNRSSYLEAIARRTDRYYHGRFEHDRLYTPRTARELVADHGFDVLEVRLANMLPLGLASPWAQRAAGRIWAANRGLARVPGVNRLATNVELVARRR